MGTGQGEEQDLTEQKWAADTIPLLLLEFKEMAVLSRVLRESLTQNQVLALVKCLLDEQQPGDERVR